MNQHITFSKAPITEAILDIKVELPEGFNLSDLEPLYNNIKDRLVITEY